MSLLQILMLNANYMTFEVDTEIRFKKKWSQQYTKWHDLVQCDTLLYLTIIR